MSRSAAFDVAIIGGGIVGTSAAAFLAEAGASVVLYERAELAAGASGRNSGAVQHPLDALPAALHRRTLEIYRELAADDPQFRLAERPAGLLIVSESEDGVRRATAQMAGRSPEVAPTFVDAGELRRLEPALAEGLSACRLETGYPVAPASATLAFARRAERAGARLVTGQVARPLVEDGRLAGLSLGDGRRVQFAQVLLAAGPWSAGLLDGWLAAGQAPVAPLWGLVVDVALPRPPNHVLEELGIGDLGPAGTTLFSLVTAGGQSGLGSVFSQAAPDPAAVVPALLERGARFVPELASLAPGAVRTCARPLSFDGRPLMGPVPGCEGLFVCTGHGPWGISTGPGSARLVADLMLAGRSPELDEMAEVSSLRVAG